MKFFMDTSLSVIYFFNLFKFSGPPLISPYFRIDRQQAPSERTTLIFTYCTDQLPRPEEIYFMLDNDRLGLNSRMSGIPIQSGTSQQVVEDAIYLKFHYLYVFFVLYFYLLIVMYFLV